MHRPIVVATTAAARHAAMQHIFLTNKGAQDSPLKNDATNAAILISGSPDTNSRIVSVFRSRLSSEVLKQLPHGTKTRQAMSCIGFMQSEIHCVSKKRTNFETV